MAYLVFYFLITIELFNNYWTIEIVHNIYRSEIVCPTGSNFIYLCMYFIYVCIYLFIFMSWLNLPPETKFNLSKCNQF